MKQIMTLYHGSNVKVEKPEILVMGFYKDFGYGFYCTSFDDVLHSENPMAVATDWIDEYQLKSGNYDVEAVNPDLCSNIPTATQMGKVYKRLILNTLQNNEDYADGILRVYNDPICEVIDNYNSSAYYGPSPYIARSYYAGGF